MRRVANGAAARHHDHRFKKSGSVTQSPLHFVACDLLAQTAGMLAHSGRRLSFRASIESVGKDHIVDVELDGADVGRRTNDAREA